MREMTILQLLHGMSVGGAEVLAARLARRLRDRYRFVFACLDHVGELGESLQEDGFPLIVLNRRSGFDWRCSRRLAAELQAREIDIIHAHQYTPFFYALTTGLVGRRPPVLFTEHGRFHPDYPRRKRIMFNRTFLRRTDRVVAVGEAVRRAVVDNEGLPAHRTQVIYNGIDLTRFADLTQQSRSQMRRQLGIGDNDFVAVLVGRLDYLKDHATALRTAERVAAQLPGFQMLFVGEGPERPKIEAEIRGRGLESVVRLLGTRHDVPELLNASDVCFLSSISEGIALTLIEGMAAGRPIVATNVGGNSEVVVDRGTGLLAPSGDDASLASHLLRLANDLDLQHRLGEAGRMRATEMFSEEQMHRQYEELFDEMSGAVSPRLRCETAASL